MKLKAGEALNQAMVLEDGTTRRLLMVKDVQAPPSIITARLLDYEAYPRMVKGCDKFSKYQTYFRARPGKKAIEITKAKYNIHALHMKFCYYMTHHWDPEEMCMVFQLVGRLARSPALIDFGVCECFCHARRAFSLRFEPLSLFSSSSFLCREQDYDKRSDIDDSVGYWYLQPKGAEECRVYYSCVTRLRTWVPGPVYALLTKAALKQATVWLDYESLKEWEEEKLRRAARRMHTPQQLMSGFRDRASEMRRAIKRNRKRLGVLSGARPEVSSAA